MTARYIVADVFDALASLPDNSVDLVLTSPPFLALRSYLPADHPDKQKEIGSEATPADFIDTLLDVVEACDRVLAPHGSLVFELGDTFAGSGGAGGDYGDEGRRAGQLTFKQRVAYESEDRDRCIAEWREGVTAHRARSLHPDQDGRHANSDRVNREVRYDRNENGGRGWPQDKSLCFIPSLFGASLAYGRNLLRPERTTDPWRIRNLVAWCRPNPPVGALGDKFRPGTSYLTVATKSRTRWFDLDAVRTEHKADPTNYTGNDYTKGAPEGVPGNESMPGNPAGAPPLDWWEIPTEPYKGSHYATFPRKLLDRPILAMCPRRVCLTCGEPSRRMTEATDEYAEHLGSSWADRDEGRDKAAGRERNSHSGQPVGAHITAAQRETTGWTDCGHDSYRVGVTLDPFGGSGTTGAVALAHGRDSILIDIDERNAELARDRLGMFLTVETLAKEESA